MISQYNTSSETRLAAAEKMLRAAMHSWTCGGGQNPASPAPRICITVSRQPGAGGISFSHRLAEKLNGTGDADWSAWDRELVEHVAAEHGLSKELIEMIPNRHRSWLTNLIDSITSNPHGPGFAEVRAYQRVVTAIRALAEQGHAIIVGLGGTFATEGVPGAIHLRLVASLEHRIQHTAERERLSLHEAAARVAEADSHRAEFLLQFWHRKSIGPEQFTMTLNSGELSVDEMVEVVLPLVRSRSIAQRAKLAARSASRGRKEATP